MDSNDKQPISVYLEGDVIDWLDGHTNNRSAFIASLIHNYRRYHGRMEKMVEQEMIEELQRQARDLETMAERTKDLTAFVDADENTTTTTTDDDDTSDEPAIQAKDPFRQLEQDLQDRIHGVDGRE